MHKNPTPDRSFLIVLVTSSSDCFHEIYTCKYGARVCYDPLHWVMNLLVLLGQEFLILQTEHEGLKKQFFSTSG